MEASKVLKKTFLYGVIVIIVLILIGLFYLYNFLTTPKNLTTTNTSGTDLNNEIYDELSKPKDYGAPISTDESGYGRTNPFAPYK